MRMTAVKTVSRTFGRKGSRKIEDDGKAKRITPGRPIFGFVWLFYLTVFFPLIFGRIFLRAKFSHATQNLDVLARL